MIENSTVAVDERPASARASVPRTDEEAEGRCVETLNALLSEAGEQDRMHVLADCLAWALARIIVRCDSSQVTGHVLNALGIHVRSLSDRVVAQREADEATKAGVKPN